MFEFSKPESSENLNWPVSLPRWVSHLITSMMKYTPVHKATVHSQEGRHLFLGIKYSI